MRWQSFHLLQFMLIFFRCIYYQVKKKSPIYPNLETIYILLRVRLRILAGTYAHLFICYRSF